MNDKQLRSILQQLVRKHVYFYGIKCIREQICDDIDDILLGPQGLNSIARIKRYGCCMPQDCICRKFIVLSNNKEIDVHYHIHCDILLKEHPPKPFDGITWNDIITNTNKYNL